MPLKCLPKGQAAWTSNLLAFEASMLDWGDQAPLCDKEKSNHAIQLYVVTGKYRTDDTLEDLRRSRRQPQLWMAINRFHGKCWCGKPRKDWDAGMRKYCCKKHTNWWFESICPMWSQVRVRVIERDGARCATCGRRGMRGKSSLNPYAFLHVDHIIPHAAGGEFWDEGNLQVLCADCHTLKTSQDVALIRSARKAHGSVPLDAWLDDRQE